MPEGTRTLILLRHGRTAWNAVARAQGHADISLDDLGRVQAATAATALAGCAPSRLWSSDLARAGETAAYVAQASGLEASYDPRLREFDMGERSGLTMAEYAQRFPAHHAGWVGGSADRPLVAGEETAASVRERMLAALTDALAGLAPGETGIVVGHGGSLKVGLIALLGWDPALARSVRGLDNCHWTTLLVEPERPVAQLAGHNQSA